MPTLHAQRGRTRQPGAIDPRATFERPASVPPPIIWYDLAAQAYSEGLNPLDAVATIHDFGDAGRHATADVGSGVIHLKDAIHSDRIIQPVTNEAYDVPYTNGATASYSVVAALNFQASGTAAGYLFDITTDRLIIAPRSGNGVGNSNIAWYDGAWHDVAAYQNGWQVLSWVLTSGGNGEIWRNGASLGTDAYTARRIQTDFKLVPTGMGLSYVAEVYMCEAALAASVRSDLERYMSEKWFI